MSDVGAGNVEKFVQAYMESLLRGLRDSDRATQSTSAASRHYKQARKDYPLIAEEADNGDVGSATHLLAIADRLAREEWAINNASTYIKELLRERAQDPAWELVVYLARHADGKVAIPSRWLSMWNMAKAQVIEERAQEEARKQVSVSQEDFEERFVGFLLELGFVQHFDQ